MKKIVFIILAMLLPMMANAFAFTVDGLSYEHLGGLNQGVSLLGDVGDKFPGKVIIHATVTDDDGNTYNNLSEHSNVDLNAIIGEDNQSQGGGTVKLSIETYDIKAGETKTMLIDMQNPDDQVTMVQFDLRLPDGLSIATGDDAIDIAGRTTWKKHTMTSNTADGITRILLYSATNEVIEGTSGAIISIKLVASSSFKGGDIKLENQLMTTPALVESKPATYIYNIKGGDDNPPVGDAEPYVVYNDGTLTFYCDNQRDSRQGTKYELNEKIGWNVNAKNITTVVFDASFANARPTSTSEWFFSCENLTGIQGLGYLNTSEVTNMRYMFAGCEGLTSLDLSGFNTANVTNMAFMFNGCKSLTSLDLSNFNTANVTTMDSMFEFCYSLTSLDVSSFNTANVTIMYCMFSFCGSLTSLDVSRFNTVNVISMGSMFNNCSSLTSLDVSSFNTTKVTGMSFMFNGCKSLTSLDVSNFNTNNVTGMSKMFYNCSGLTTIYVGDKWSTANVSSGENMFSGCTNLVGGNGTKYDASHVDVEYARIDKAGVPGYFTAKNGGTEPVGDAEPYVVYNNGTLTFYCDNQRDSRQGTKYDLNEGDKKPGWSENANNITTVVFDASFANARPKSTAYWFYKANNLSDIVDIKYLNTRNVTSMSSMFLGCSGLTRLDVSNFNTSNVTSMASMFSDCTNLASLDVSNFNTSNVTSMRSMFLGCSGLTRLDVSNFNTSNVTSMGQMFYGCTNLTSLDLSHFNTSNVAYMNFMFYWCINLSSLNISSFDTKNVTGMRMMFRSCMNLTSLDVSNFDVQSATDLSEMFADCSKLATLDVSKFNTANVETMGSMFRGCKKLTSLNLSSFSTKSVKDIVYETWTKYAVDGMLNGCSNLSEVTFGSNFATDENLSCAEVFAGCNSLGKVIYTGDIPASIHPTFFNGVGSENVYAALNVPEEYLDNYAAKFDGGLFYGGYFTLFGSESSELKDGDVFTAKTVEGVEMTFMVVSAKDKTCQVGDGKNACIDTSTSGSLTIPAEVNGLKVNSVASWALYRCSSLSEIVISEGIESLMSNSIEQCNSVTSFVLPSSVTSLSQAFGGISSNLKSIKVEDGNPVYDSRDNCNAIIETATNTLRCGCSATVIPLSVTAIGDWSMSSKNLTSVSIPNSVTYIGEGALRYNYFKSVVIPASVSTIAGSAFSTSYKLEDVTILSKNCTISGSAFGSCSKLKKVVSHIETPEAARGTIFYNSYDSSTKEYLLNDDVVLYVPKGTKEVYEQTDGWKNFTNIVEGIPATGDVTGEGEVNTEDVIAIAKMILSGEYRAEADVNGDGVVNVADIIEIINLMNASQTTE